MPRTEFLQIRVTPEDRARFQEAADLDHLDLSTWARRILLQAIERAEGREPAVPKRRVAEPTPDTPRRRK